MISFKQFLSESTKFDLEKFKEDCSNYLGMLKGTHGQHLLYRGTHDYPKDFRIETWKERSGPRDSSIEMHDQINAYFKEKFGVEARDWMFCSGHAGDASIYGHRNYTVIFPIGKFQWLTALNDDAHDMTGFNDRCKAALHDNPATRNLPYDERIQLAIAMMKHKMDKWTWYDSFDIVGSIKAKNEIMFKCDKFYAFAYDGATYKSQEFQTFLKSL